MLEVLSSHEKPRLRCPEHDEGIVFAHSVCTLCVSASENAHWFFHYYFSQNGVEKGRLFLCCKLRLWVGLCMYFVFLWVPCGVHWRVEKEGKAAAWSLAQQQVPGFNSQQWLVLFSLHDVRLFEWFISRFPLWQDGCTSCHRTVYRTAYCLCELMNDCYCIVQYCTVLQLLC